MQAATTLEVYDAGDVWNAVRSMTESKLARHGFKTEMLRDSHANNLLMAILQMDDDTLRIARSVIRLELRLRERDKE